RGDRGVFTTNHLWSSSKPWDPEGLLSTIPALATALGGILAGVWLKKKDDAANKIAWMFTFGLTGILAGLLWNLFFPINKALWTSSYVLYTAGWASSVLALLYWLSDVKGYRTSTRPYVVYGGDANAVFLGSVL